MRVHCLLHADSQDAHLIKMWAEERHYTLTFSKTYLREALPNPSEFDLLIITGGPQRLIRLKEYPYLPQEIKLIAKAIKQHKAILGICLGAQLIGEAFGAKTQTSPQKEFGVFPVKLTEAGEQDAIFGNFPNPFDALQLHNDTPSLPKGAMLLAKSERCPHQVFRMGKKIYGTLSHLEITQHVWNLLIKHPSSMKQEYYDNLVNSAKTYDFELGNQRMKHILDQLATLA